jgi:hypothetical protein
MVTNCLEGVGESPPRLRRSGAADPPLLRYFFVPCAARAKKASSIAARIGLAFSAAS